MSSRKNRHGGSRRNAGRSALNLEPLKDQILDLHLEGNTYAEIASKVGSTEATIRRRFGEWGIRKKAPVGQQKDLYLRTQIAMFFMSRFTDNEITLVLNSERSKDNCVNKRTVVRICKSQGLVCRMSAWDRQEANKKLWDIVQQELDTRAIESYSKGLFYIYFKCLG